MFDFGLPLNSKGNIINKGPNLNSAHLYLSITVHIIKSPIYQQSTTYVSRSSGYPVLTQQYEFDSNLCHFLITFNKVAKWAKIIIRDVAMNREWLHKDDHCLPKNQLTDTIDLFHLSSLPDQNELQ